MSVYLKNDICSDREDFSTFQASVPPGEQMLQFSIPTAVPRLRLHRAAEFKMRALTDLSCTWNFVA